MTISERRTNQDVINKIACSNCFHGTDEHDKHKCYALEFDGTTYSSCKCQRLSFEFKIRLNVPDINLDENN